MRTLPILSLMLPFTLADPIFSLSCLLMDFAPKLSGYICQFECQGKGHTNGGYCAKQFERPRCFCNFPKNEDGFKEVPNPNGAFSAEDVVAEEKMTANSVPFAPTSASSSSSSSAPRMHFVPDASFASYPRMFTVNEDFSGSNGQFPVDVTFLPFSQRDAPRRKSLNN